MLDELTTTFDLFRVCVVAKVTEAVQTLQIGKRVLIDVKEVWLLLVGLDAAEIVVGTQVLGAETKRCGSDHFRWVQSRLLEQLQLSDEREAIEAVSASRVGSLGQSRLKPRRLYSLRNCCHLTKKWCQFT